MHPGGPPPRYPGHSTANMQPMPQASLPAGLPAGLPASSGSMPASATTAGLPASTTQTGTTAPSTMAPSTVSATAASKPLLLQEQPLLLEDLLEQVRFMQVVALQCQSCCIILCFQSQAMYSKFGEVILPYLSLLNTICDVGEEGAAATGRTATADAETARQDGRDRPESGH